MSNHFTSVLAEYGLPDSITADFGPQYVSEKFKAKCNQEGIQLNFSSPYHHQANGLAERCVETCKNLLKKALEENECPYTAIWMYRTTPLDNNTPSPYELLFGRKPRTNLPSPRQNLKSRHPDNEQHHEANIRRQTKQAEFYNRKVGFGRRSLDNKEPVYVKNTLKKVWEPGSILQNPDPQGRPRTYWVDIGGKIFQRTREHLKPRITDDTTATKQGESPATTPSQETIKTEPADNPPASPAKHQEKPEVMGTQVVRAHTTRYGRKTIVPDIFRD